MISTQDERRKRSAVVTGAGSGLGRDIALGLAAKGSLGGDGEEWFEPKSFVLCIDSRVRSGTHH
jgi:hypothetical protein